MTSSQIASAGFGPVSGPHGTPLDQIRLIGVTARGYHGVFAHERRDGQDFTIDAVLHVDMTRAAASDDLADTVNYGTLAVGIADIVRGEPVDLIETLAARIAASCLESAQVAAVDIFVHKPHAPITEPFTDVVVAIRRERPAGRSEPARSGEVSRSADLDLRPAEPVTAVLALGTNLGDRFETLNAAVHDLADVENLQLTAVSPVVETDPVGGPEQPDYLNAVVLVRTTLAPRELLAACQRVETGHGRERIVRWGPRTLDIDVIRYGDLLSADPVLELPHPRAAQRAFVLDPWLAVNPQGWLPGESGPRPLAPLLAAAPDRSGVRRRPDLVLDLPVNSGAEGELAGQRAGGS
jgi:dihydroneopterin aldolase/2-amino-4-hydroxy-6-hydroxymethyldihydropteridine diphosphokinase